MTKPPFPSLNFERAIGLDPKFAMAYALLGTSWENLGERNRGMEFMRKAHELRERVNTRERFYIDSCYQDFVNGDLDKARQAYEVWAEVYPRDDRPVGNLGLLDGYLGQHERSLVRTREALQRQPRRGLRYANLVQSYFRLNRFAEARAAAEEAHLKDLDSPFLCFYRYRLAFLQNDPAEMSRQVAWPQVNREWTTC